MPSEEHTLRSTGRAAAYAERAFFHSKGGSSKLPARLRCAAAYAAAFSLPCSISSTDSDGAIQVLALTLYTDACTPIALCSENKRRCSPPPLTSATTPSSNITKPYHPWPTNPTAYPH